MIQQLQPKLAVDNGNVIPIAVDGKMSCKGLYVVKSKSRGPGFVEQEDALSVPAH